MSAALATLPQGERIATVLIAIEAVDVNTIHAVPLLVIERGHPARSVVGLHVGRDHFRLSIDDMRMAACALRIERGIPEAEALGAGLDMAADTAALLALAQLRRTVRDAALWGGQ